MLVAIVVQISKNPTKKTYAVKCVSGYSTALRNVDVKMPSVIHTLPTDAGGDAGGGEEEQGKGHSAIICSLLKLCNIDEDVESEMRGKNIKGNKKESIR